MLEGACAIVPGKSRVSRSVCVCQCVCLCVCVCVTGRGKAVRKGECRHRHRLETILVQHEQCVDPPPSRTQTYTHLSFISCGPRTVIACDLALLLDERLYILHNGGKVRHALARRHGAGGRSIVNAGSSPIPGHACCHAKETEQQLSWQARHSASRAWNAVLNGL